MTGRYDYALLGLLAAGCVPSIPVEDDSSWLYELQVLGIVLEPPELGPTTSSTITVTAADPRERGADVLIWSCTDLAVGCYEQLLPDGSGRPLDDWTLVGALLDESFTSGIELPTVPDAMIAQADEQDLVMLVWVLTCAPGVCEVIERVKANPAPGTEAWDVAVRQLAWPDEWLDDIESGWASLAVKTVPIRVEPDNVNPTISGVEDSLDLEFGPEADGGVFDLALSDDDANSRLSLEVYSTFGEVDGDVSSAGLEVTWEAPRPGIGTGRVWAVVTDDDGGQAVWRGDVSVLP